MTYGRDNRTLLREQYLRDLGAVTADARVIRFSDERREVAAMADGAGITDLGHRDQLYVDGPDAAAFLNRLLTYNVMTMQPGDGARTFLLSVRGRVILIFNLYRLEEDRFHIDAPQGHGPAVMERLDMFHFGERMTWGRLDEHVLFSIQGSEAEPVLAAVTGARPEAPYAYLKTTVSDIAVQMMRNDRTGTKGFDICVAESDFVRVWESLLEAKAVPVGFEALEVMRIHGGVPSYPNEFGPHSVPLEVDGMNGISEGKGCYPGQETIERTLALSKPKRTLVAIESSTPLTAGTLTAETGKTAGELTSVAQGPDGHCIGLALIKHQSAGDPHWLRDGSEVLPRMKG